MFGIFRRLRELEEVTEKLIQVNMCRDGKHHMVYDNNRIARFGLTCKHCFHFEELVKKED